MSFVINACKYETVEQRESVETDAVSAKCGYNSCT